MFSEKKDAEFHKNILLKMLFYKKVNKVASVFYKNLGGSEWFLKYL
jgi:hypothetical protein